MAFAVQSMVSTTYVRDIATARAFYELLGFREQLAGKADTSAWMVMQHDDLSVLLASTKPSLAIEKLPLLFYFYYDDLDAVIHGLHAAGVEVIPTGRPPHALGGEARVLDPDGNTLLLGQRERSASQSPAADDETSPRFSLLKEAAALVEAQGGTTASCQVSDLDGVACPARAEVKLADSSGGTAWVCLAHADEMLMTVRGAFVATQGEQGIVEFLSRRR